MTYICIYNSTTKAIEFAEEYDETRSIKNDLDETGAQELDRNAHRLDIECQIRNGLVRDSSTGEISSNGPWKLYVGEKEFAFETETDETTSESTEASA